MSLSKKEIDIKKHLPKILYLSIAAALIALFYIFRLNKFFTYENITAVRDIILKFSFFGPVIIFLLYILFNILCLPTLFFNFLSGYLYGPIAGFFVAWIGMSLGLLSSFFNVRYFFRKDFQSRFKNNKIIAEVDKAASKYRGWSALFFRVFFIIPYNMQNIAYGLSGISVKGYFWGSVIGILPTTIMHVAIGRLIYNNTLGMTDLKNIFMYIGIFIGIFGAIFFTSYFIKRKISLRENNS